MLWYDQPLKPRPEKLQVFGTLSTAEWPARIEYQPDRAAVLGAAAEKTAEATEAAETSEKTAEKATETETGEDLRDRAQSAEERLKKGAKGGQGRKGTTRGGNEAAGAGAAGEGKDTGEEAGNGSDLAGVKATGEVASE
ncbi:hypothetical protein Cob_v001025 [Colletotrichum orbiculare MAFF 240422]|uniref:Uncharacterized protein n=1 Tax=Colletotrichum orbiculare (strain 104-T / ATCC 96160 / CBS 514.97 / LARS 414 / MAFF 240422) TaxID=1213857 RepID=A0A484G893_COLOR|nr:hypothetical protein Cob_v001025 [Colletotrichum orbiculare MAFF 240422]